MSRTWKKEPWHLQPVRVFGGFRVMWVRWQRTDDGWEQDYEPSPDRRTYATELAAAEAIPGLQVGGMLAASLAELLP